MGGVALHTLMAEKINEKEKSISDYLCRLR